MAQAALKRSEGEAGQPLYIQLALALGQRIAKGEYEVGGLLPTEAELGALFGVSRYTVRQAIQHLRHQGLVSARKGVGTRVEAAHSSASYTHSMHSLQELLQYAHETRLDVQSLKEIAARGAIAEALGCRPGRRWLQVIGVRHGDSGELPICISEVYVDAAYKGLAKELGSMRTAIWSLIERRFGETVVEVEQQIAATNLGTDEAQLLDAAAGAPALRITRRYFVTGRRLVQLSVSLHPSDRFTYAMTIKRDQAPG